MLVITYRCDDKPSTQVVQCNFDLLHKRIKEHLLVFMYNL